MIPNRPLTLEESAWLAHWKTICQNCFGWSSSETEAWVNAEVRGFDSTEPSFQYHYHPIREVRRLFIPSALRERFRLGKVIHLSDFYAGLEEALYLDWDQLYSGFPPDFDWNRVRTHIERLIRDLVAKNEKQ